MQNLLQNESVKPESLQKEVDAVLAAADMVTVAKDIERLWADPSVQAGFAQRNKMGIQIPSTASYFFDNVARFAESSWLPSTDDILRAKLKTTGISETTFSEKGTDFVLTDVGGQRSERRKWLHCFDDVTNIIYLAALDEYNMTLEEDNRTNRMEESLRLFTEVSGSHFFKSTSPSWILFLNKSDLFKDKISREPLSKYFSDVSEKDGSDFEKSCEYIKKRYEESFRGSKLFVYVTCVLDTYACKNVFAAVKETIVMRAFRATEF